MRRRYSQFGVCRDAMTTGRRVCRLQAFRVEKWPLRCFSPNGVVEKLRGTS